MDHFERLRQVHESHERVDASAYANLVREALRSAPSVTRGFLQQTYEKGLQAAYSSRDEGALAKVALMGAELLNSFGDHEGAIARLNQALQMAIDDPGSQSRILAARAGWESFSADPTQADQTLAEAIRALPSKPDVETTVRVETLAATVSLLLLRPGGIDEATIAISRARTNDFDWMASSLMVLLISALGSSPDANQAVAWADALHGYAASLPHEARELDASVAQLALRTRHRLVDSLQDLEVIGERTHNINARWRLATIKLYAQAIGGDPESAAGTVQALDRMSAVINAGFATASEGFPAFVEAHFGSGPISELAPPRTPTLFLLGGALASAEAVAIAGTQSSAADWLLWFETRLPSTIATSLEWPSCRRRVEGLLLLRLGREREAVTRLQEAIQCCDDRHDNIQAAIGRVQLSEALLRGTTASMLPATHARSLREAGSEHLRTLGIDPIPFAYAASRTFLQEEQMPERGGLTPREAQVLGRLAKGMTYREIGTDLGINSRTVGVHASHCYEKLGVRNRVEAVKLAQDLGIV